MKREILLCGASIRSLANAAIQAGLHPHCVDFFADHDLLLLLSHGRGTLAGRINSFADLPERTSDVPLDIPMVWAGGLENWPEVIESIQRVRTVLGASTEAIAAVRDVHRLSKELMAAGLQFPCTRFSHPTRKPAQKGNDGQLFAESAEATDVASMNDAVWLKKRYRGSGGNGVTELSGGSLVSPENSDCYFQQKIDGVPMSATFLARDHPDQTAGRDANGHSQVQLLGSTIQIIGWKALHASGFEFCGNAGPVDIPASLGDELLQAGRTVAEYSGLRGIFGIDFILKDSRPWFLEVNPRLTASHEMIEWYSGRSLLMDHCQSFKQKSRQNVCPEDHSYPSANSTKCVTVSAPSSFVRMIIYSDRSVSASEIFAGYRESGDAPEYEASGTDFLWLNERSSSVQDAPMFWLADIPAAGSELLKGHPACSFYLSGNSLDEIAALLRDQAGNEKGFGNFFREMRLSPENLASQLTLLGDQFQREL